MFHTSIDWLRALDLRLCLACNRAVGRAAIPTFRFFGRVGDGPLWVLLAVPVYLFAGWWGVGRLAGSLVTAAVLYRVAKATTARPRPHVACPDVRLLAAPLDRYSFPSGHTLHAVATAVVVGELVSGSGVLLWPLAVAIALSRVVLGLHYPSDVAAGAALGCAIGVVWVTV